ncbi:MAG: AAA family ATPase [Clostridia bacterium]|nr:AAA family ATPase [Clostridia bacterium]
MKIKNIKINSYGTLKEKEISLGDNLNIIYGKNESGKSTLLNYIKNIFYGISKNKNGKEISDYEKYKPWIGEEFSGKIKYRLDDGTNYEIYRDFSKKNAKLFNDNLEDISNQYKIDKKDGSQFFCDQTNVDEKMYLSTIMTPQQEVVLDHTTQNILVQKMANLAGTGEDTVSFQKAMDKLNKRLVEEVGTNRTQDRPLNLIQKRMKEIEIVLKDEVDQLKDKRNLEGSKDEILEKIEKEKDRNNGLRKLVMLIQKSQIDQEKNTLKNQLQDEKEEKIKNLKEQKENLIKNNELNKKVNLEKSKEENENRLNAKIKKRYFIFGIIFILLIGINILSFTFIQNKIVNYIFLTLIPIELILFIINYRKNNQLKKEIQKQVLEQKLEDKLQNQKLEEQLLMVNNQINLLEKELQNYKKEIEEEKENIDKNLILSIEEIKREHQNLDISLSITNLIMEDELQKELNISQQKIMEYRLKLNGLEYENKNVSERLEEIVGLKEEYENLREQLQIVEEKNKCIQATKELLEKAYEEMKKSVTPKFTQNLSELIKKITDGKYQKVSIHEEKGIIVELQNGEYIPASLLSVGTIDQLYLSLRLAMLDEISQEKMPIILDEAFAYFDEERLKNSLLFLLEQAREHQIMLFTCTKREKQILDGLNLAYHWIEL